MTRQTRSTPATATSHGPTDPDGAHPDRLPSRSSRPARKPYPPPRPDASRGSRGRSAPGRPSGRAPGPHPRGLGDMLVPEEFESPLKREKQLVMPGTPSSSSPRRRAWRDSPPSRSPCSRLEGETSPMRPTVDPFKHLRARIVPQGDPLRGVPARQRHHRHGGRGMQQRRVLHHGGGGRATGSRKGPPPDLPSLLLNARIVYIAGPSSRRSPSSSSPSSSSSTTSSGCRPRVTTTIHAGFHREKGECVGVDSEAYAILDTMRYIRPKIHTVAVGKCFRNAAMLLAAGDKGCRHRASQRADHDAPSQAQPHVRHQRQRADQGERDRGVRGHVHGVRQPSSAESPSRRSRRSSTGAGTSRRSRPSTTASSIASSRRGPTCSRSATTRRSSWRRRRVSAVRPTGR